MSKEKPLTMKEIYEKADESWAECSKDVNESAMLVEAWMNEYFTDPENRAEIDASPLKGYTTEVAIGLLMQDVYSYLRRKK